MATRSNPGAAAPKDQELADCIARLSDNGHSGRPLSTYRVQFHKGFTFNDARAVVPYLASLGISHLYGSPILKARPGSVHGYDINDHNRLNPEVGTEEDFRALTAELKRHGMSLFLDIVPNHMGVGFGTNPWWQDVLENGRASAYADFFDIDWEPVKPELRDKVLIPVLGDPYGDVLERGELKLTWDGRNFVCCYYERKLAIDPQTVPLIFEPLGDLRALASDHSLNDEDRSELESVLWDLRQLPPNRTSDPSLAAKRQREAPELKARLRVLAARSERVAALIAHAVELCNGRPGEAQSFDALHRLLEAQAYRVAFWRVSSHEINYRRFFDINDLIGLRMENPRVFAETHKLIRRMIADGSVSGIRLDHPDGLYNPLQYFTRLQALGAAAHCAGDEPLGPTGENGIELDVQEAFSARDWSSARPPLYVLVEKILEHGEHLPADWPVDGTVGYEFAILVNGLFIDGRNERALTLTYRRFTDSNASVPDMIYEAKKLIMRSALASEITVLSHMLEEIAGLDRRARDFTRAALTDAIREVIACFPVYRTYIDERGNVSERDRGYICQAIVQAKRRNPGTNSLIFDFLQRILLLEGSGVAADEAHRKRLHFVLKFQQLTGPVMAKGLEDTVCYRYNRLVSVNEVGGSPDQFGTSVEEFHAGNMERLRDWPNNLLGTSTHDTKRSEDVRARINVISEMPRPWTAMVMRWRRINRTRKRTISDGRVVPDANEEYLLYQTILGAWPMEGLADQQARAEFVRRIQEYMNKAVHEAKVNLSWVNDNPEYTAALAEFIAAILTPGTRRRPNAFLEELERIAPEFALFGAVNSLSQTVLKLTAPGVPDIYNGCELFDLSLVDPDNRRPVDYELRRTYLEEFAARENDARSYCEELLRNYRDGRVKMWIAQRALRLRLDHPQLFRNGNYTPLYATGEASQHVVAFSREAENRTLITAVPRLPYMLMRGKAQPPVASAWGETRLALPPGQYRNVLTGESLRSNGNGILCRELFGVLPVALLLSD